MSTLRVTRMLKTEHCVIHLAIAAALMGHAIGSQAQEAGQLEEVFVTAQKRAENLQDVPISVQSLNAAMLEKNNIISISDIRAAVPGLTIAPYPSNSDLIYPSIRGVKPNAAQIATPLPMAIHINGVYVSILQGLNTAAADISRIEVIKGPQGVLSGRNATGGALNIYTAPADLGEFWFKQQVTVAERGQLLSKTQLNVPLGDTLAAKLAYVVSKRDHEGVRNSAPGGYSFGKKESEAWRADFRWRPSNGVTLDYGFDYSKSDVSPTPMQCLVPFSAAGLPLPPTPGCGQDRQSSLYSPYGLPQSRLKVESHTLNVEWEASPAFTLKSITGYRKVDAADNGDFSAQAGQSYSATPSFSGSAPLLVLGGGTPFNGQPGTDKTYLKAWSQELQFLGDLNPNLKYTAGLYYSEDEGHQNLGPRPTGYLDLGDIGYGFNMGSVTNYGFSFDRVRNTSKAIFGQLGWRPDILERRLEVVPGVRYTRDTRSAAATYNGLAQYLVVPTAVPLTVAHVMTTAPGIYSPGMRGDLRFSNTSPSLAVNYHWSETGMAYAKVSKAYTTGGLDYNNADPVQFAKGFEPEKVKSIELGMKAEFFNRRLRTNFALFETKYTNEQKTVTTFVGTTPLWVIQNAGGSTYRGAELDINAAVSDSLKLSFNGAWLKHEYTSYVVGGINYAGEAQSIVPKFSYNLSLDYRFPNWGLPGKLDGTLSVSHKDAESTPFVTSLMRQTMPAFDPAWMTTPAYTVWNGRLALSQIQVGRADKGDLTIALWGRNLTDRKYLTVRTMGATAAAVGGWGEPRTVGLDVIYRY